MAAEGGGAGGVTAEEAAAEAAAAATAARRGAAEAGPIVAASASFACAGLAGVAAVTGRVTLAGRGMPAGGVNRAGASDMIVAAAAAFPLTGPTC